MSSDSLAHEWDVWVGQRSERHLLARIRSSVHFWNVYLSLLKFAGVSSLAEMKDGFIAFMLKGIEPISTESAKKWMVRSKNPEGNSDEMFKSLLSLLGGQMHVYNYHTPDSLCGIVIRGGEQASWEYWFTTKVTEDRLELLQEKHQDKVSTNGDDCLEACDVPPQ